MARSRAQSSPYHLRPARLADAPAILAVFESAPAEMARQDTVRTLAEAERTAARLAGPRMRAVAIATEGADELVGVVAVSIDEEDLLGWFFYWLHAEHRGRGVVSRAAAAVANRALRASADEGFGLERLELGHRRNNPASGGVARAAGFVHEGTEREKFLVDGARIDVLTYGRLRSDPVPPTRELPWADEG